MQFKSAIVLASLIFASPVHAASTPTDPDLQRLLIETKNRIVEGFLIGTWSTVNYFGHLVNPATGEVVQSLHSGRWFIFNDDRTYKYMRIGSGQFISGLIVAEGTFEVIGKRLLLHRRTESWYPSRDDPSGRPMYKDRAQSKDSIMDFVLKDWVLTLREEDQTVANFRRDPNSNK